MATIIVVSFSKETNAIEALHHLKKLDAYGDITLYEHMMIRKVANNQYEVLNDETDKIAWRTFTGMALGGLIGAFTGPLGLVIGLYTGTAVGAIWEFNRYDFEDDFVKKVSHKMTVGNIAIIAEVAEDSPVFIDNALTPLSTEIIRSEAEIEFNDYVEDQIELVEEKIEFEREKLKKATDAEKASIKAKIAELKETRTEIIKTLETKRKSLVKEVIAKTKASLHSLENGVESYEEAIATTLSKAKKNRLRKKIKRQEDKLNNLRRALHEAIKD